MRVWTVHLPPAATEEGAADRRRPPEPVLVREAFSWGAFLFGPLWLLAHRLWLAALLWFVAAAALLMLVPAGRAGRRTTMRVVYGWPVETTFAVGDGVGRAPIPGATVAS